MPSRGDHLDPRTLTERGPRSAVPWSADHVVGLVVANGVGLVLVFVGWWEAAGLGQAHDQLAWLNLSLLGLVLSGGANGLWLARGRRVVTLARARVLPYPLVPLAWPAEGLAGSNRLVLSPPDPLRRGRPVRSEPGVGSAGLVASSAMSHYHRTNCLLVVGKEVNVAHRSVHEAADLKACEVCVP
jgi:hypothetical protein